MYGLPITPLGHLAHVLFPLPVLAVLLWFFGRRTDPSAPWSTRIDLGLALLCGTSVMLLNAFWIDRIVFEGTVCSSPSCTGIWRRRMSIDSRLSGRSTPPDADTILNVQFCTRFCSLLGLSSASEEKQGARTRRPSDNFLPSPRVSADPAVCRCQYL